MSCATEKVAVTLGLFPFVSVNWQVGPVQAPLNPEKVAPDRGLGVKLTLVPLLNVAVQVEGQLIPAGLLVTVPEPVTVTVKVTGCAVNVADTDWLLLSVSVHEAPLHAPPNPVNPEPAPAVAVSVTDVPDAKLAVHVEGQLIPLGLLVTVPGPVTVTVN